MPTLIATAADFKRYIAGNQKSLSFNTIEEFITTAERRFIAPAIGTDFFNFLCTTTLSLYTDLKSQAARAAAWYAYMLALPHLRVTSGDLGVMMNQPARTTMAPKWAHVDLLSSTTENADAALEELLAALEELDPNASPPFSEWFSSEGYLRTRKSIIRNATQLTEHLPIIAARRRTYLALRFYLSKAEDSIARSICTDEVFDALKTKYQNDASNLTSDERRLLHLIADLIAPYALHRAIPSIRLKLEGDGIYVQTIDDSMRNQTPSTYPAINDLRNELFNTYQEAEAALVKWLDTKATATLFAPYYTKKQATTRSVVTASTSSLGFF